MHELSRRGLTVGVVAAGLGGAGLGSAGLGGAGLVGAALGAGPPAYAAAARIKGGTRLAPGSTLIFAGDSLTSNGQSITSRGDVTSYPASHMSWLRWLTGDTFRSSPSLVFAVEGYGTGDWIAGQQTACLSAVRAVASAGSTPVVILRLGADDLLQSQPAQTVIDNLRAIISALQSAGATVIAFLIGPRAGYTDAQKQTRAAVNSYLGGRNGTPGLLVFDPNAYTADPATGLPKQGYLRDDLHGTAVGYHAEAAPLAAMLTASGSQGPGVRTNAVLYPPDEGETPGNAVVNGRLAGVGGQVGGGAAQTSGVAADGWLFGVVAPSDATSDSPLTTVWSKAASPVTGEAMQQVRLSGAPTGVEYAQLRQDQPIQGFAAGDLVRGRMTVEWDEGLGNVLSVAMIVNAEYAAQSFEGPSTPSFGPLPSDATRLVMLTAPFRMPAAALPGTFHVSLMASAFGSGLPVSGAVRFGDVRVVRVDPTPGAP